MECIDLTLDQRRALPVEAETIAQLINHRAETGASFEWTYYVHDIRTKLPDCGLVELQRWAELVDADDLSGEVLDCLNKQWNEADRPFNPRCDSLLIDLIRDSAENGFAPSPRVAAMIKQAVANENARQLSAERHWQSEADREYTEWLASREADWFDIFLQELPVRRAAAEAKLASIEKFRRSFMVRHATDDEADKLDDIRNQPLDHWNKKYKHLWTKPFKMKPTPLPPPSYPEPSNSLPTNSAVNLMAGHTATTAEIGRPYIESFLAQAGQPTANAPRIPDAAAAHPLFGLLNDAIARLFGNPSRAAASLDMLAVLNLVHEETFNIVRDRLRSGGAVFSDAKLQGAVQRFHARVAREIRSGAGWITDAKGVPDPQNSDNVGVFLNTIGIELRFNAWTNREEIQWSSAADFKPLQESDLNNLLTIAANSEHRFRPADGMFKRSLKSIAREATFDPVVDWLAAAEASWDGVPRLDSWLARAIGVPNDAYLRAVGRNLIGGICKRVRQPGCKHDETVILMGAEDTYKSTLCRVLAMNDNWFTDSVDFSGSPQNTIPQLFGRVIVELAELDGMAKRDVQHIKRFLSAQSDNVTLKYEAFTSDHARRCIFIGTSNETNPLRSDTGNRRFLPVHISKPIDMDFVRDNLTQIIGEAATLETAGESFMLPRDVIPEARARQEAVRAEADFEVHLDAWFGRTSAPGYVLAADLATMLKDATGRSIPPSHYGNAMRRLGFVQVKPRLNGEQMRVWCRGGMEGAHHFSMCRMADGRRVPLLPILALPPVPG